LLFLRGREGAWHPLFLSNDWKKIDSLFKVLAVTKVEIANASVQAARIAILDIVEKSPGLQVPQQHSE